MSEAARHDNDAAASKPDSKGGLAFASARVLSLFAVCDAPEQLKAMSLSRVSKALAEP